jgi:hypothetical protein
MLSFVVNVIRNEAGLSDIATTPSTSPPIPDVQAERSKGELQQLLSLSVQDHLRRLLPLPAFDQ